METWTARDMPSQRGKLAVVTGGYGGIGFVTATELVRAGAEVVIAGRDARKAAEAADLIGREVPGATVHGELLDLASLDTVEAFAEWMISQNRPVDLLVNNAGVMNVPEWRATADGFELTMGTNHLGHFALTGRLLPLLLKARSPRIVMVSSVVARIPTLDMTDLLSERSYRPMIAYAKSKLANLLFAVELQRRAGRSLTSLAVHPGSAMTGLQKHSSERVQQLGRMVMGKFMGQSPQDAALTTLFAATYPSIATGGFYTPAGFGEARGGPHLAKLPRLAQHHVLARDVWTKSETLTGVQPTFPTTILVS